MIFIGPSSDVPPARHTRAIVTLAIGTKYEQVWDVVSRPSWERYAAAHGYDLIVLNAPIDPADTGRRSPAWQKCLILSQSWSQRYERILWLDADIVVNPAASDIAASVPEELVGATLVNDQLSSAEKHILLEKYVGLTVAPEHAEELWGAVQNQLYRDNGIETDRTEMIATGVLVLAPGRHEAALRGAYAGEERSRAYEQPRLSHRLLEDGLFHKLSPRWNWGIWDALMLHHRDEANVPLPIERVQSAIRSELDNAYFLHFYQAYFLLEAVAKRGWSPV